MINMTNKKLTHDIERLISKIDEQLQLLERLKEENNKCKSALEHLKELKDKENNKENN